MADMHQVYAGETPTDTFNCSALLDSGEAIASVTSVTIDPAGEITLGTPAVSGDDAITVAIGGTSVAGHRYALTALFVTSTGRNVVATGTIAGMTS